MSDFPLPDFDELDRKTDEILRESYGTTLKDCLDTIVANMPEYEEPTIKDIEKLAEADNKFFS